MVDVFDVCDDHVGEYVVAHFFADGQAFFAVVAVGGDGVVAFDFGGG